MVLPFYVATPESMRDQMLNRPFKARRLVMHGGFSKTGTTAIQTAFAASRETLLATQGLLYPGQTASHNTLIGTVFTTKPADFILNRTRSNITPASLASEAHRAKQMIEAEIRKRRPDTVLLSAEAFSNLTVGDMERLLDWLSTLAHHVEVAVTIRNPMAFALSMAQQTLKRGLTLAEIYDNPPVSRFAERTGRAASVFGRQNLHILVYEDLCAAPDGLLGGFVDQLTLLTGQARTSLVSAARKANPSLSMPAALMLDAINRVRPAFVNGQPGPKRTFNENRFLERIAGPPFTLPLSVLEKIVPPSRQDLAALKRDFGIDPYPELTIPDLPATATQADETATLDSTALLLSDLIHTQKMLRQEAQAGRRNPVSRFIRRLRRRA